MLKRTDKLCLTYKLYCTEVGESKLIIFGSTPFGRCIVVKVTAVTLPM